MALPSREPHVLGNSDLSSFDVIVIGSGAGGSVTAWALATHGKNVLVLEAGDNFFPKLDDPAQLHPPLFSNDELKMSARYMVLPDPLIEPRTFRPSADAGERTMIGDVNGLPKTVGGGAVHADMVYPRFQETDFRLGAVLGEVAGAAFADWPLTYDELEPFYTAIEQFAGVQGDANADPYASRRSADYPMPPGNQMYVAELASAGARKLGYEPFPLPQAINSRPFGGRPACIDCGFCSGYGCPNHAKGSPAVTFLRAALLTGHCVVRHNAMVTRLLHDGGSVSGVAYIDASGKTQQARGNAFVLAASPIEDARLCLLSDRDGGGLGNSSGAVGRHLMFHAQTYGIGIMKLNTHVHRGRSVTAGMTDFRGRPNDPEHPLGGIIEFGGLSDPIMEAKIYASRLGQRGENLARLMRDSPFREHLLAMNMLAEDAPQPSNMVDLDPAVRDVYGLPVARVTYQPHAFELHAREFYGAKMLEILQAAGAQFGFIAPLDSPPQTSHVMGTLRMGTDARTSVCDAGGRFHDVDNLWCTDGAVFPTSSGFNPTLTIQAMALRTAGGMLFGEAPERVLQ